MQLSPGRIFASGQVDLFGKFMVSHWNSLSCLIVNCEANVARLVVCTAMHIAHIVGAGEATGFPPFPTILTQSKVAKLEDCRG